MATTVPPQLSAAGTSLSRSVLVAGIAFVLAGTLRLTAASEQLTLSRTFAVLFFIVAVAQLGFGILLSLGARRATTTLTVGAVMVITLALVGVWLVATTATVPIYPLMNGPYPIDVIDLSSTILEITAVIALRGSLAQPARGRVTWTVVALLALAWLVWVAIVVTNGLSD